MTSYLQDSYLTVQNNWWKEGGLAQDPDLARIAVSPLKYRPRPIQPEECAQEGILTLRGPRRAGKTIALKLLIADLIETFSWEPQSILWMTADTIPNMAALEETLSQAVAKHQPKLFCIDEITAVAGWQRVLKKLRDIGTLKDRCVILTGSSAHDLKAGAERMAGRRGEAARPDRILLPMGFSEFKSQLQRTCPDLDETRLQAEFLICGGFPFRVESWIKSLQRGEAPDPLAGFQVFDDVLFYEFGRRRLDRNIALEIVARLGLIGNTALSYESFAKPMSAAKDTVRKYLDALGDAFLLATVSTYDTGRGRVAPKKDRKFLWVDPALGLLPLWLRQGEGADEATRAEMAVGMELLRRHESRIWEGLSAPRNVFTWKSSSGNEVDFLAIDHSRKLKLPVEVKYQESISDWDFQVVERAFGTGTIVTKAFAKERAKATAVPLARFLETRS